LQAKEWHLPKYGCLISVPDTGQWTSLGTAGMPDSVLVLDDEQGGRTIVLNVTEVERGNTEILGRYARQMEQGMKKAGARDVTRKETVLSVLKAYEVSGTKSVDGRPVTAATRVCVFGRYMYVLTLSSSSGPIGGDEKLRRAIEGFSVPAAVAMQEVQKAREAEAAAGKGRFNIRKYWVSVVALLGAVFLGLWLRTRARRST
jgi:hypothetical protein